MMGRFLLVVIFATAAPASRGSDNWPQWRGTNMDGVSDSRKTPIRWSETENIAWKTPLPAWGGATPIVWNNCVFVLSPSEPAVRGEPDVGRRLPRGGGRENPGGPEILLLCINKSDGSVRWERPVGKENKLYGKHNYASPSPVTDGTHVWTLTGGGVLTCLDFDGNPIWKTDLQEKFGEFGIYWGYASSPLLHEGRIIVQVLHGAIPKGPSYIAAFDGKTGELAWRVERVTDAERECPDAYTTPIPVRIGDRTELVISGADYLTGHDPATGSELWRCGGLNPERRGNYRICGTPIAVDGVVVATSRIRPVVAMRAGGRGDVSRSHLVWRYEDKGGPDVPSPVSDGKRVYLLDDKGLVTCLDATSGEMIWGPERTATGTVSASPLLVDGKLYLTNENATTTVLEAGSTFKVLATNELGGGYTLSSFAVSGSQLFLRTATRLYCIGTEN